jgi:heptosyltransferase-2
MEGSSAANNRNDTAAGPVSAPRVQPAPERILIKAVNWLGDLVMSTPAMRAVRRAYPGAHIAALVKKELAGFFDAADLVDEIIPYTVGRGLRGLNDRRKVVGEVRARKFDLAVLMPNSFESALWMMAAGVPRRAGYRTDARGAMLTDRAAVPRDAVEGHQVQYWLAMLREVLGVAGDPEDFALAPAERHLAPMREWLAARRRRAGAPLIAIAPAAAYGPAKEWPARKFAALIDAIDERGAESVLVGAPAERARADEVARLSSAGALIAAGDTGVGQLIALLSLCNGFVGNDSGAMHLAAALGLPTVGIFGSTNPMRTGPLGNRARVIWHHLECSPCLARTCRFGHYNCLGQVEPGEALDSLGSLGVL